MEIAAAHKAYDFVKNMSEGPAESAPKLHFYLHKPPAASRGDHSTKYLPVANHGTYDDAGHGGNSVYALDSQLDTMNVESFNYPSEQIRSYCDGPCPEGCVETITAPGVSNGAASTFDQAMAKFHEIVGDVNAVLAKYSGEQWVQYATARLHDHKDLDYATYPERMEAVRAEFMELIPKTDETGTAAFDTLRRTVKGLREDIAHNHASSMSNDGLRARSHIHADSTLEASLESLKAKKDGLTESLTATQAALDKWNVPNIAPAGKFAAPDEMRAGVRDDEKKAVDPTPIVPAAPAPIGGAGSPGVVSEGGNSGDEALKRMMEKLEELYEKDEQLPLPAMASSPLSDAMPGGMPGGGMPGGGMPGGMENPFATGMPQNPFADEPLNATKMDPIDGPDDESGPPVTAEERGSFATLGGDGDDPEIAGDEQGEDDAEPPSEAITPIVNAESSEPVAADPNSVEARTVTLPDGRDVEFPNAHMADTVRSLVESEPGSGKSLYSLASQAGFDLPPMGQDIGDKVPPVELAVGDLVQGAAGEGIYVGNDQVLMADQSLKPLTEVATFETEDHGIFRLTEPDHRTDPLLGSSQTVSGSPSDYETVSSSASSSPVTSVPGMPTDDAVPVQDTTSLGSGAGLTSGDTPLDPSVTFPN